jgi:hypothetical protein
MLTRQSTPQREDKDWHSFAAPLVLCVCSDYMALRLLYYLEPLTAGWTLQVMAIEVAEKALKLFVTVHGKSQAALSEAQQRYGHNLERLRHESAAYDSVFDDDDVKEFTKPLADKAGALYQHLRYGSQTNTSGHYANFQTLIPIVDKIFFMALLRLPEPECKLLNFASLLKHLVTSSRFDQSRNPVLLLDALRRGNAYLAEYVEYCRRIDEEHAQLTQQLRAAE